MRFIYNIKKWWRIKFKDQVTVLDVLEYANKHRLLGLCVTLDKACDHYNRGYDLFKALCPKFNHDDAVKHFNAKWLSYWWPVGDWSQRGVFLDALIKYYRAVPQVFIPK